MARWDKPKSAARPRLGNRIFTIVVLALLLAMTLSAIFVPLGYFRSQGEVAVSYGSVTVRRDLYVYWLSEYKYDYLKKADMVIQDLQKNKRNDYNGPASNTTTRVYLSGRDGSLYLVYSATKAPSAMGVSVNGMGLAGAKATEEEIWKGISKYFE